MFYVIENNDGSCLVMRIIPYIDNGKTVIPQPEDEILKWDDESQLNVKSITFIQETDIPDDRYFRDAWILAENKIGIDMDKARAVQMDKIRAVRNERLQELDIQTLKGIDVQTEKQVLRDIPQTFDLTTATTPEELKALWPEILT